MDLGLAFDDEDLHTPCRDKVGDQHLPYNVKLCNVKWFISSDLKYAEHKDNSEEMQHMLKFDADLHYRQQNYSIAIQRYETLLEMLPENNVTVRHDVKESMSRCYTYLGDMDRALQLAIEVKEDVCNEDEPRYRQSLILLSFVYEKSKKWKECIESLEKLCWFQPFYPQTWDKLGDMYACCLDPSDTLEGNYLCDPSLHCVKQLTCFLRARFLLSSVQGKASKLVKCRNEAILEKLSQKVAMIQLKDGDKIYAQNFIDKELIESIAVGFKDDVSVPNPSDLKDNTVDFYSKFCQWHIQLIKENK